MRATPNENSGRGIPNRLLHPIAETAQLLGLGMTKTRELIATGELDHVAIDRRVLVPRQSIEFFIARKLGES